MQLHKQHKAWLFALQNRPRLSNMFVRVGLPLLSSAPGFSFAKFKRKFRPDILVWMRCEKEVWFWMLRVVQPAMEALTVQLVVLVISVCSEFQPSTGKKKKALAMCQADIGLAADWMLIKSKPLTWVLTRTVLWQKLKNEGKIPPCFSRLDSFPFIFHSAGLHDRTNEVTSPC